MIENFSLNGIATYQEGGVTVSGLKKVNFFYGANGCGKTTVSNFLQDQSTTGFDESRLSWQGNIPLKTLVYNKNFRSTHFGSTSIPGIFTLGRATQEQAAVIEEKKTLLSSANDNILQRKRALSIQQEKLQELQDSFTEEVWVNIYQTYKDRFSQAFIGYKTRKLFLERLLKEFKVNTSDHKNIDELERNAKTIFGDRPERLPHLRISAYDQLAAYESDDIWNKKIVGKSDIPIAPLINRLNINDWVHEGKHHIKDSHVCPFCQEDTITEQFRDQLESFFDQEFTESLTLITKMSKDYLNSSEYAINQLKEIEKFEKDNRFTKLNLISFSTTLRILESIQTSNKTLVANKLKEPSRSIELISSSEHFELINSILNDGNLELEEHNSIVTNFDNQYLQLINEIWKFLIEENKERISTYNLNYSNIQSAITGISSATMAKEGEYRALDQEIKILARDVTSVQPAVDAINQTLLDYGFQGFKIIPSSEGVNRYQIVREDGTPAEVTLSEGEITFITFLYYLQLVNGSIAEDNITEERIAVIDDPISSLDSNVLFIVSTLIKKLIRAINENTGSVKQLIILTHNVYFHKEVSYRSRAESGPAANFWILRKIENVTYLEDFGSNSPIQNSYELLWRELRTEGPSSSVTIQNTMRRILENYFKILGGWKDDDILDHFSNPSEKEICKSLLSWVNEGSHTIPDDLFIQTQEATIDTYKSVFKNVFDKSGHLSHYNMMMGEDNVSVD